MNKRFMSLLLVLVMVFSLLPISAMAEVYIFEGNAIQVEFYKSSADAKPFNTQRVLTTGTDSIYDPGCELEENTVFVGWQINGTGDAMDIAGVRKYVKDNASSLANKTVKVVASVSPVHYVVYYDESNPARVIKTVAVIKAKNNNSWTAKADLDYNPVDTNSDFYGWKTADGRLLGKNADITDLVEAAVTTALYPDCRTGSWITFNENDKWTNADGLEVNIHATYRAPAFIEQNGSIDISDSKYNVSAEGYTFAGWFTEAGEGPLSTVNEGQTVYAHWTAKDNIEYKVAYWQQNANDDGYSLVANDIETKTGTAGTEATYDSEAIQNKYQYFHLNTDLSDAAKERVVIAGDGSTIRNVYFDRDVFTLTFKGNITYVESGIEYSDAPIGDLITNSSNITTLESNKKTISEYDVSYFRNGYAIKVDGNWYSITDNGNYVYNATSISFPGVKTITAKYEENISSNFPIAGYTGYVWAPQNSSVYKTGDVPFIENMKPENTAFQAKTYGSGTTIHFYYYTEATGREGSDVTKVTYDGKTYVEHQHVQISSSRGITSTEGEDFIDIEGYKHNGSNPSYNSDGRVAIDSSNKYTMKFYYARKTYNLKFNSNGSTVHSTTALYQEALNGKAPENFKIGETTRKDSSGNILIFQGWYDNADFAGNAYNFAESYMPSNDLIFYAKWSPVKHRVVLDANTGKFVTDEGDVSSINFTVEDGGTVEANNPTKENYNFIGWYTDENLTQRFNPSTRVTGDVLTAPNYPVAPETDPDSAVRGKLTLYAKWRPEMDANTYIQVQYDADGGTVNGVPVYSDPLHYAAAAEAVAQPAAAPASDEAGKSFRAWQILNAADEVVGEVLPGNIFNVNLADAEETTVDGKTVYVVTLKADYAVATSTHIVWYGNGGTTANGAETVESADANLNAAIQVKPADTFTREGYEFLGWARLDESKVKVDGKWTPQDLTKADLWLIWDGEKYIANEGSHPENPYIAANEKTPHHVLYAVWDQIDNHNYVIDFNGKMTIATSATAKKDDSHNNGAFEVAGGNATYQLKADEKDYTNGANLAFNGIDTALINGVPVGSADGTTASWEKYTVIPANNVYFDDSLVEASMTAGDGSGFNADVKKYETSPTAGQSQTKIEITFTGTGIDVYCTTDDANGWIQATVDGTNKQPYTNTKYQGDNAPLYNIPVVSFRDLGAGSHKLVITTLTYANYRLDGIRVYNGMQDATGDDATTVNNAYAAAKEQNAVFMQVRQYLLDSKTFGSLTSADGDTQAFTGALFVDTKPTGATVSDYQKDGPKNEVYLDAGQGVAFQIKGWADFKNTNKVMVGLSVPAGGTATVAASGRTGNNKIELDAKTHMFYTITPDESGNVYIYNTGNAMVSVTDLKITGTQQYAAPATFTLGAPITPESEGGALTVSPKLLMRYVQDFDPEAVIEDPQVIDEPQTPETPDDGDKPGWNDNSYNPMTILKNLFQNLLNSLSGLFGGLGKW